MQEVDFFERRVGSTLRGKWTLERLLGVGGMAAVYEAVHVRLGRREAVKILHPQISHSLEARQRFEQEARAVTQLQHPGAVEVRDIDVSEEGAPFLVMELLEGESLAATLQRRGPLGPDEVARFADQVLDVLAAAHAVDIVHRDIKPDNLFLRSDGRIKVLDFGVARLRQRDGQQMAPTRTGALIGTVAYMPPEQVSGRSDVDGRADLFSVGATMFRLLTGRHLHPGDHELQQIMQMASEPAPPLRSLAPHVPEALAAVVDRALAFDRDRRFPDATAMQLALREAVPELALAPGSAPPGPSSPRSPRPVVGTPSLGLASDTPLAIPGVSAPFGAPSSPHAYEPTVMPGVATTPDTLSSPGLAPLASGRGSTPTVSQATAWQGTASQATASPVRQLPTPLLGQVSPVLAPFGLPYDPSPSQLRSADGQPVPVTPGSTAVGADEPSLVRLGRQTVVLPMPLLAGGAAAVTLLLAVLVGSLVWSRAQSNLGHREPEPIMNPEAAGTGAGSLTSTPAPVATPARSRPSDKDKKKGKKDD